MLNTASRGVILACGAFGTLITLINESWQALMTLIMIEARFALIDTASTVPGHERSTSRTFGAFVRIGALLTVVDEAGAFSALWLAIVANKGHASCSRACASTALKLEFWMALSTGVSVVTDLTIREN